MLRFAKYVILSGLIIAPLFSFAARDEDFLNTVELNCVGTGIDTYTGKGKPEGLRPSPKFLALLGFGMQRFQKDTGPSGYGRKLYQQRVIEFIQANGYCLATTVDGGGVPTKVDGYGGIDSSNGKKPERLSLMVLGVGKTKADEDGELTTNAFSSADNEKAIKFFGFKNLKQLRSLFKVPNWSSMTPQQRQERTMAAFNDMHISDEGLEDCIKQLKNQQKLNPDFKHGSTRSPQSIALCKEMADACNFEPDEQKFCSQSPQGQTAPQPVNQSGGQPSLYQGGGGSSTDGSQ